MTQTILCIDMESVLTPELWQAVAKGFWVEELMLTTKDIDDNKKLMEHRLKYLNENDITYSKMQEILSKVDLLPWALDFLNRARDKMQVIILSDTFIQLGKPFVQKLWNPTIFCHDLIVEDDKIVDYKFRIQDQKTQAVKRFKQLNFKTFATWDSFNDTGMIKEADAGCFFQPGKKATDAFPEIDIANDYEELKWYIDRFMEE